MSERETSQGSQHLYEFGTIRADGQSIVPRDKALPSYPCAPGDEELTNRHLEAPRSYSVQK